MTCFVVSYAVPGELPEAFCRLMLRPFMLQKEMLNFGGQDGSPHCLTSVPLRPDLGALVNN